MCLSITRACACGKHEAHFMHRDNLLPTQILLNLYCPRCRTQVEWNPATMIEDGGWILEYDMEDAEYQMEKKGFSQPITPEFIFEEGYCCWNGLTPHDLEERTRLYEELAPLLTQDRRLYIQRFKETMLQHVSDLKAAGWRKAQNA